MRTAVRPVVTSVVLRAGNRIDGRSDRHLSTVDRLLSERIDSGKHYLLRSISGRFGFESPADRLFS
ncbi:hypothetical protein A6E15_05210 [Natrinema saccharevitans]|uniref:Uncharacterized protein n=1 Tax=Natrinema saccharevitans TaxID=301967 RepID=A0A1S8AV39_9EURY|nr:hypothetical protein A6E15_05210 [Natrinema saccharevitans]